MQLEIEAPLKEDRTTPSPQEEQWKLAERVACSRSFSKSQFLSRFLLYVCGRKLQNKVHEITEQQIGVAVFGRPLGYDCGEDNIVRNYARTLRKRLEEYFDTEGQDETWHIDIPRGGYTPVFTRKRPQAHEPHLTLVSAKEPLEVSPAAPDLSKEAADQQVIIVTEAAVPSKYFRHNNPRKTLVLALLLLILSSGIGYALYQHFRAKSAAHLLWTGIFSEDQNTLFVPADSGIGILQNLTRQPIHIDQYESRKYLNDSAPNDRLEERELNDLRTQRYTSVVDLDIILSLNHLPELKQDRTFVRFARDLTIDDMKNSNIVLLGSSHANPWVEIFEKELNFHFVYGPQVDDSFIKNERPLKEEQKVYSNEWNLPSHRTYAVVALRPNLGGKGWVLLIEGLNMAGTQAAADVLLHDPSLNDFLKQESAPNHRLRPFELLIETTSLGSQPGRSRIVARRIA